MSKNNTDYVYQKDKYIWKIVIFYTTVHIAALYGIWILPTLHWQAFDIFFYQQTVVVFSVTMGAHRYFSHKCFKINRAMRLFFIFCMTSAGQDSLFTWVRDHRLHHKYIDTDDDPYNAKRGFYFSHMGWFLTMRHPLALEKGRKLDLSDLTSDPFVMFAHRYYKVLFLLMMFIIPTLLPVYFWNENWLNMFAFLNLSYVIELHRSFLVNSVAHYYGTKPYKRNVTAIENKLVSYITFGEGWHNYHHAFPSDCRASEYGLRWSVTTVLIDICAYMGLVWDLKSTPAISVQRAVQKTFELEKESVKLLN